MAIRHKKTNQKLKHQLKTQGLSQIQLAYDLNLDRIAVNIWCNGWQMPKIDTRVKIADYLDVPLVTLWPDV